jgi:hypothetical protein
MLADNSAAIHQISYSIFKKLGREDDELVKTNLTPNGVGGNPMEARDVVSMELTVGTKLLATTLFVIEVQDNYSVIFGSWLDSHQPLCFFYFASVLDSMDQWRD